MNIHFTSDWHLWHTNIIKYAKRPFANVTEMNRSILDNFFETVRRGDTVYFLGDFAFSGAKRQTDMRDVLREITNHCKFHVVLGNHDSRTRGLLDEECESVTQLKEIKMGRVKITLCHYPMHSFNGSHKNSWQLYGHHHRDTNTEIPGKRYNVSVDVNEFKPISFPHLHAIMRDRDDNWDFISPERAKARKELARLQDD